MEIMPASASKSAFQKRNYKISVQLYFGAALLATLFLLAYRPAEPTPERLHIALRWCRAHPGEKPGQVTTGMAWALSHLGAALPQGTLSQVWVAKKGEPFVYDLYLDKAGFGPTALDALATIVDSLKRTEEYERYCSIDLGRFVVLTVHSPYHYYRITGVPRTYASFRSLHDMDGAPTLHFPVIRSSIANGNRIVEFRAGPSPRQWAFVAAEGTGRMELGNFEATEYEVFDIMPNGQLRFAIYDRQGALEAATPLSLGEAGKPGNCMWCHESSVQTLFSPTHHVPGKLSPNAFRDTIRQMKTALRRYQREQYATVQFDSTYHHTEHELLYITFMEPTLARVAAEWQMTQIAAQALVRHLPTHYHPEFPWLGPLYRRRDIEPLAPVRCAPVPTHVREAGGTEVDFWGDGLQ
jgi:hypothetical protein